MGGKIGVNTFPIPVQLRDASNFHLRADGSKLIISAFPSFLPHQSVSWDLALAWVDQLSPMLIQFHIHKHCPQPEITGQTQRSGSDESHPKPVVASMNACDSCWNGDDASDVAGSAAFV
jgi:hypothetical protein